KERTAVRRGSTVEEARNIRMLETGQDLALMAKPAQHFGGIHTMLDDFDGNELVELIVVALGQVHRAHTAAADLLEHAIGTETDFARGQCFSSDECPYSRRFQPKSFVRAQKNLPGFALSGEGQNKIDEKEKENELETN